jgi:hypothetical protein
VPSTDPYELLGVPREASQERIRQAYELEINRAYRLGSHSHAVDLSRAYDTLSQPQRRALYDRHGLTGVRERSPGAAPPPTPWREIKRQPLQSEPGRPRNTRQGVLRGAAITVVAVVALLAVGFATGYLRLGGTVPIPRPGIPSVVVHNAPVTPDPASTDLYGPGMCIYTDEALGTGHVAPCPAGARE